jgi:hypothetical protein
MGPMGEGKKIRVPKELRYKRGTHIQLGFGRGMLISVPSLNMYHFSWVFRRYHHMAWSKGTLNPHLGLEFTTTVRVGVLDEPGDGRVLLAEVGPGEMRGSDTV